MSDPNIDPRFPYEKIASKNISLDQLDEMASFVLGSGTGMWGSIIAGLKILVICAYLWARKRLIDEAMLIQKQKYEQDQTGGNQGEIGNEDMDGR